MRLSWHTYRYYPYERVLALREVNALLKASSTRVVDGWLEIDHHTDTDSAGQLTYFAGYVNGSRYTQTVQARLEAALGKSRQATRYSAHGLHEYKGKFNPQVVRAILNIFDVRSFERVLDPFCGSGTTLVECAHRGASGFGTDLNPFAVYLANAKLLALSTPSATLEVILGTLRKQFGSVKERKGIGTKNLRGTYLRAWFDTDILHVIENVKGRISAEAGEFAPIFLSIASNLLRAYSRQDPNDLRIRRRKSPLPHTPFAEAFLSTAELFLERLRSAQSVLGIKKPLGHASLCDVATLKKTRIGTSFDAALTSPPYAMALPYIDTQRLSLVWLDLLSPDGILDLEAELIGSRELRGRSRRELVGQMYENGAGLPVDQAAFCMNLQKALTTKDGFRRKAVPIALYRYFASMRESFRSIRAVMKPAAPFALIVGHNHTILGGVRYDINTPAHLAKIATSVGWKVEELIELQTYHRYGYHMNNAVAAETLIFLRNQ